MKDKNILIFNSASDNTYISLKTETGVEEVVINNAKTSEVLLVEIDNILKKSNIKISDVSVLGVCVGPGSFTGIRVGISLVKALAQVCDFKVVAYTTFDLLAYNELKAKDDYLIVVKGFSNFVYASGLKLANGCYNIDFIKELLKKNKKIKLISDAESESVFEEFQPFVPKFKLVDFAESLIEKKSFSDPKTILPVYLRASQAEIEKQAKGI